MSRNGEALPGRPRIQADPGTQKEIGRRTPKFGASGAVVHTPTGVFYEPKKQRRPAAGLISFKLSTEVVEGGISNWQVSASRSCVQNGTDGPAFDLTDGGADWKVDGIQFDTPTQFSESSWILLKCAIAAGVASDFELVAVTTEAEAVEVVTDAGDQIAAQLLIGYVKTDGGAPPTVSSVQGITQPQVLTAGFVNGIEAMIFEDHKLSADFLLALANE